MTRTLAACEMTLAGCQPDFVVETDANITCATDSECPEGFICAVDRCVSKDANQPPRVVVGVPARSVDVVDIPITVADFEADEVSLSARYSTADGFHTATIAPATVSANADGVATELHWQAASDLSTASGYVRGVVVEVTPAGGQPALSPPFDFGNDPPAATPQAITGTKSGDVGIAFLMADEASDLAAVSVEFSASSTGPWSTASITLGTTHALSTSPDGIEHAVIWNSREAANADAAEPQGIGAGPSAFWPEVYVRITPSDVAAGQTFTGTAGVVGPFAIDNTVNAPPSIQVTTPDTLQSGVTLISYTLLDAESDPCDLIVEVNAGSGFVRASGGTGGDGITTLESSATGVAHQFAWDTVADRIALSEVNSNVILRFAGVGITQGVFTTSQAITVDNRAENEAPSLEVIAPSGVAAGDSVALPFVITDDEGDVCDVEMQYQDGGGTWRSATAASVTTGLSSSAGGTLHTLVWQSLTDGVAPSRTFVDMQARVSQPAPVRDSGWVPFTLEVDNGVDLNQPPEVLFPDAGPTAVLKRDYDIYIMIRDPESDTVEIDGIDFTVNGTAWLTATLQASLGPRTFTTTSDLTP